MFHDVTLLEVPEGRHNAAHRFNGEAGDVIARSPGGAAHMGHRVPSLQGLSPLLSRGPTAFAVGYVLSSLTGLVKTEMAMPMRAVS